MWGGMQYQLEHHLFPTIPRYKYRHLVPLVRKFAEENGIEYRATGQWEIIKDNVKLVSGAFLLRFRLYFLSGDRYRILGSWGVQFQ